MSGPDCTIFFDFEANLAQVDVEILQHIRGDA